MIENTHMAWLTDQEYLDLVQPESRIGKALHARLTRLLADSQKELGELRLELSACRDDYQNALRDIELLTEG